MITAENDYQLIIYEQPFTSHTFTKIKWNFFKITTGISTVIKPGQDEVQNSGTNHIYQNIQKQQPREKIWTIFFLLESPKSKEVQPSDLEIDFLIDSGAESNRINIPTWNEIKTLHPTLVPIKTASKLATAQGSS